MFFLPLVTRRDNTNTTSASHNFRLTPIIYELCQYLKTLWWVIGSTTMKYLVVCYINHVNDVRHVDIVFFLVGIEVILYHQ